MHITSPLDAVPSHSIYSILASFGGGIVNEKNYKFASTLKERLVGKITKSFVNKSKITLDIR